MQWVSTRTPNAKFRLLLYFLDISHGHTAIFMAPGVTYFWYHPHPGGGARLLEDYLSGT
jgi:hypothetical protein